MTVFLAVLDAGSLSAAARSLRTPLTTVSRKVADLEEHLGARLLLRTRRRVEPTAAGRAYADLIRPLLDRISQAERLASGEYAAPLGELAITAPVVFGRSCVMPLFVAFLAEHPDIRGRALLVDRHVDLAEEHIDVAVRIGSFTGAALVSTRLGAVQRVVCASPAYLARRGAPAHPEELRAHDAITFKGFAADDGWAFERGGAALVVEPGTRLSVNSTEAAVDAAIAGLGLVRVLSYQVEGELRAGALKAVLGAFTPNPTPVSLVYPRQGRLPLKVRAFVDWAAPRLRERLAVNRRS